MREGCVDTSGIPREAVLAVLYNAAAPNGLGFLKYDPRPMDLTDARYVIAERGDDLLSIKQKVLLAINPLGFDYLRGRPLKVSIWEDALNPIGYDGKNGPGTAARAVASYRATGDVCSAEIFQMHLERLIPTAQKVWDEMGDAGPNAKRLRAILDPILHPKGD